MSGVMVLAVQLVSGVVSAAAVTNFYDNFSGPVEAALNRTVPDVRPGAETWTASSVLPEAIRADGSFVSGAIRSAYLPVQIEANKKYTLTAILNISNAADNTDSAGIGFLKAASTGNYATSDPNVALIVRRNGQAQAISTGGDVATNISRSIDLNNPVELKIILDTTSAIWTAEYFINGRLVANKKLSTSLCSGLNYINLGKSLSAEGKFVEFCLMVVSELEVPAIIVG
jgi:hypothetical protein